MVDRLGQNPHWHGVRRLRDSSSQSRRRATSFSYNLSSVEVREIGRQLESIVGFLWDFWSGSITAVFQERGNSPHCQIWLKIVSASFRILTGVFWRKEILNWSGPDAASFEDRRALSSSEQLAYKSLKFLIYVFPLKLYEIDTTWIQFGYKSWNIFDLSEFLLEVYEIDTIWVQFG